MIVFFPKYPDDLKTSAHTGIEWDLTVPVMPKVGLEISETEASAVKLPINFIEIGARNRIWQDAIDISKNWSSEIKIPTVHGVKLQDCIRLEILPFIQDVLTAELFAARILEEGITSAVFPRKPSRPSHGRAMHDGTSDIFEAVVASRLSSAGTKIVYLEELQPKPIEFERATSAPPLKQPGYVSRLRGLVRKTLSFLDATRRPVVTPTKNTDATSPVDPARVLWPVPHGCEIFVGIGSGYDLLVMWPYLKAFANEQNCTPLLINTAERFDGATLRSGLTADSNLKFLYVGDIPHSKDEELDIAIDYFRNTSIPVDLLPSPLNNKALQFQYDILWKQLLPDAATAISLAKTFLQLTNTKLILDDWTNGIETRAWALTGNTLNIPTVTVPHGATNLVEFHSFASKWSTAWGNLGKENISLGNPDLSDQIVVTGDPSMESIRLPAPRLNEKGTVLLLTGGCLHQAWTDLDLPSFVACWRDLLNIATRLSDIEFVIKTHPSYRDFADWYERLVSRSGLHNIRVVTKERLEDVSRDASLAVIVARPGTAGLVTLLNSVPTIYYKTGLCRDVLGFHIWTERRGIPTFEKADRLQEFIANATTDPQLRAQVYEQNRLFLREYLKPFDAKVSDKFFGHN